jgi:hypothetical protein
MVPRMCSARRSAQRSWSGRCDEPGHCDVEASSLCLREGALRAGLAVDRCWRVHSRPDEPLCRQHRWMADGARPRGPLCVESEEPLAAARVARCWRGRARFADVERFRTLGSGKSLARMCDVVDVLPLLRGRPARRSRGELTRSDPAQEEHEVRMRRHQDLGRGVDAQRNRRVRTRLVSRRPCRSERGDRVLGRCCAQQLERAFEDGGCLARRPAQDFTERAASDGSGSAVELERPAVDLLGDGDDRGGVG